MNASSLLRELGQRGIRLEPRGERLHVQAPEGALTNVDREALRALKPELLDLLHQGPAPGESPLAEEASRLSSVVRFTLTETTDVQSDLDLLRAIRMLIGEYEVFDGARGGNRIDLTVVTLDGERRRLRWRAYASRELRLGIASLMARDAVQRRQRGHHGTR